VAGSVAGLALPQLDHPIAIDLQGLLKGVEHDGRVTLQGSVTPATHDAKLAVRLASVDMLALQPYLFRLADRSVRHGTLSLAIDATVANRVVHAPGQLTMTGLQFDEDGGSIAGLQRRALLAALKRDDRIALKFTIDGRTDDPRFSLDEHLALRVAGGLGDAVGDGAREAVQGMGDAIKGLLGKRGQPAGQRRGS
jgi:Domain of Unknown Function (DUF748)